MAHFIATLDTNCLQIETTTIGRIPPSSFSNDVKGVEAINSTNLIWHLPPSHRLTTRVVSHKRPLNTVKPSPHSAPNKCYACRPSLPHEVHYEMA